MSRPFEQVEVIFHELVESSPADRGEVVNRWKATSPEALQKALVLFQHSGTLDAFLETPISIEALEGFVAGTMVDDFRIVAKLGEGSFGTVYLADQISLGRAVALKVSADLGDEGRTMAPLEHDNIVRIFSERRLAESGRRLLCMQYIPGKSLERWLADLKALDFSKKRKVISDPLQWCLQIAIALARALSYAHSRGVLHLDVKPGNILIHENGTPFLSDFNISWSESLSSTAFVGGTERYMSPEQEAVLSDRSLVSTLRPESDLYSLGIVLREMSESLAFSDLEYEQIVSRLTQKEATARYASALQAEKALASCLERRAVMAALPPRGLVRSWEAQFPSLALFLLPILPQLLGSAINITYNQIWIISKLNEEQVFFFKWLVIGYNPIVYGFCLYLILRRSKGLFRYLSHTRRESLCMEALREDVRLLPRTLFRVISLAWVTGAIFFPSALYFFTREVPPSIFLHFFASFALSCLVATTYTFLYTQMFLLRNVYPDLLRGVFDIRMTAKQEMRGLEKTLRWFHYQAAVVPLFAAGIILWIGALPLGHEQLLFKLLVTMLLASGAVGAVVSLRGLEELSRTLSALCAMAPERNPTC